MGTLVDVIHEIIHDESFGSLHLSIFVFPSFTSSNVYNSAPIALHSCGQRYRLEAISIPAATSAMTDLDVFVLQSFTADHGMDVKV